MSLGETVTYVFKTNHAAGHLCGGGVAKECGLSGERSYNSLISKAGNSGRLNLVTYSAMASVVKVSFKLFIFSMR